MSCATAPSLTGKRTLPVAQTAHDWRHRAALLKSWEPQSGVGCGGQPKCLLWDGLSFYSEEEGPRNSTCSRTHAYAKEEGRHTFYSGLYREDKKGLIQGGLAGANEPQDSKVCVDWQSINAPVGLCHTNTGFAGWKPCMSHHNGQLPPLTQFSVPLKGIPSLFKNMNYKLYLPPSLLQRGLRSFLCLLCTMGRENVVDFSTLTLLWH